jgi:hypothetical protein
MNSARRPHHRRQRHLAAAAVAALLAAGTTAIAGVVPAMAASVPAVPATAGRAGSPAHPRPAADLARAFAGAPAKGGLDCNGFSPVQAPARTFTCTDVRGFAGVSNANTWGGRFYDNGHYIGHDEPDASFLSTTPGSGGDVTWALTLGKDPSAAPTDSHPGKDVSHWFELSDAAWLSMALCDPNSYPQRACQPGSDANAPTATSPGGGSAMLELQFYPPGFAPVVDAISCDNGHWCAALTIDSLECTAGMALCNADCEEPVNASFVETDGIPAAPPNPQSYPDDEFPDAHTLLMNPGDKLSVQISDQPVPGEPGQHAVEVVIRDLTTGSSGSMQASAKNGFQTTSMANCSGTPFDFQPEYSTAAVGHVVPWAAVQTDIGTAFETGHFEPCASLSEPIPNPVDPTDTSTVDDECSGPYERAGGSGSGQTGDALCYQAGATHAGYDGAGSSTAPDEATGCLDDLYESGDLGHDGTPYWTEWPVSASPTSLYPSSFVESLPGTTDAATGKPATYSRLYFQTDTALAEPSCTAADPGGCRVPPSGPGGFFPYWSEVGAHGSCSLEFGDVSSGADDFGRDAQYGGVQFATLGYPEMMSTTWDTGTCPAAPSQGYLLAGRNGAVVAGGDAPALPSVHKPSAPVVGIAGTPDGGGYFAVTDTGVVTTAGDAVFRGDLATLAPAVRVSDIVAIAPTTDGGGYWLIGADGGEFAFGNARYHGSLPGLGIHVDDVIGMVASSSGAGYLIVGADGGVFAFGATHFFGSLPGIGVRVDDIRAILPAAAGTGYILVGADGGAFSFGHGVPFHGSLPGEGVRVADVVGIALTPDDNGYWMAGANGAVYHFGDARSLPDDLAQTDLPITAISGMDVDRATGPQPPVSNAPPGAGHPVWTSVPVPEPVATFNGTLLGSGCASATDCYAVGWGSTTGSLLSTLIEHWDGSAWAPVPSPDPTGAGDSFPQLNAVTCVSSTDCTTVGTDFTFSNTSNTVVEQWDGTTWSVVTSPDVAGANNNTLTGISCLSASFCMAVGSAVTTSPDVETLVEQWNGSSWTIDSSPDVSGALQTLLTSVSCLSTSNCTAVGYSLSSSSTVPVVETWNGTAWALGSPATPEGSADNELSGVSCPATNDCVAVGRTYATNSSPAAALAEQWDGASWTVDTTPNPTDVLGDFLSSVSCPTSSTCEAAGEAYLDNSGDSETLVEQLAGGTWSLSSSPDAPGVTTSFLASVACGAGSASCVAVGQSYASEEDHLLGISLASGTWKLDAVPGTTVLASAYLQGAGCSGSSCVAVGYAYPTNNFNTTPLIEQWNGESWSSGTSAEPAGADLTDLYGAACPSPTDCIAVGDVGIGSSGDDDETSAFAERWNGSSWSTSPAVGPGGDEFVELTAVSCPSTSVCTAVGFGETTPSTAGTAVAERLSGGTWTLQSFPLPAGATASNLFGVSCPSPGACTAVGSYIDASGTTHTLAATWSSAAGWSSSGSKDATGATLDELLGVACTAAGVCEAGGYSEASSGVYSSLAERLSGGTWTVQISPDVAGAEATVLTGLACPATDWCDASGYSINGSGDTTLVAQWRGGAWALAPTGAEAGDFATGLNGIACVSETSCTAAGSGPDGAGQDDALVEVLTGASCGAAGADVGCRVGAR